jgi:hypothetical protein
MTAVLTAVVIGALAAAVGRLLRESRDAASSGAFEDASRDTEPAAPTFVALGRIKSLLHALPDERAEEELIGIVGDVEPLREALR